MKNKVILISIVVSAVLLTNFLQWGYYYQKNNRSKQLVSWVTHTYKVINMTIELRHKLLTEIEKKDKNFDRLKYEFENLKNMVLDNPAQSDRIDQIKKLILESNINKIKISKLFTQILEEENRVLKFREEEMKNLL